MEKVLWIINESHTNERLIGRNWEKLKRRENEGILILIFKRWECLDNVQIESVNCDGHEFFKFLINFFYL